MNRYLKSQPETQSGWYQSFKRAYFLDQTTYIHNKYSMKSKGPSTLLEMASGFFSLSTFNEGFLNFLVMMYVLADFLKVM